MADTFISYSRHDTAVTKDMVDHLRRNELEPWLDIDDRIPAGNRWSDVIKRAIENAGSLVVMVTPHALSSQEVSREVEHARQQGKPIIPFILALPENAADSESDVTPNRIKFEHLPVWIGDYQIIDARAKDLSQAFEQLVSSTKKTTKESFCFH